MSEIGKKFRGDFHFVYNTEHYDATVAFYRDGLELPILGSWDEGAEARGTVFRAASGTIEVIAHPTTEAEEWVVYSPDLPRGVGMAFEVEDVVAWYQRACEKNLPMKRKLESFNWGQRGFAITEPNGLIVFIYSPIN